MLTVTVIKTNIIYHLSTSAFQRSTSALHTVSFGHSDVEYASLSNVNERMKRASFVTVGLTSTR